MLCFHGGDEREFKGAAEHCSTAQQVAAGRAQPAHAVIKRGCNGLWQRL